MSTPRLRWGVLGTGTIASLFVEDLRHEPGSVVSAVASRAPKTARRFGARLGVDRCHGSYEDLFNDADVDIVYVATPPSTHAALGHAAIAAGKHLLVEKPFALNSDQAASLVEAAKSAGVFLMEGMWSWHLPHILRLRELIRTGVLGEVRLLTADHGLNLPGSLAARLYDAGLGGGALLDLGVYPVSLARLVFAQQPTAVAARSVMTSTGVDRQTSVVLEYANGAQALLGAALEVTTSNRASVSGTCGRADLQAVWYRPTALDVTLETGGGDHFDPTVEGVGLHLQAAEARRCIQEGRTESSRLPTAETLAVMRTLDDIRRVVGLAFPDEEPTESSSTHQEPDPGAK
jgi:predicted dehydrogenase